ncbi:dihydrofolate reductase family protein [Pseudoruegeria sp. HB172150]|uniref:dihydrofolate reductase family protein n=1 Tax=Pseudoruegeria sp. HB172150 TaxID=2721164 RepID=UPI0015551D43|nr:dihydrofolate reductase family protein [Pseudoruegeria sp. HB172150]
MTTGHVFIAVSLDGYIARPDGSLDWLTGAPDGPSAPEGEDFGYAAFIERMDGLVMGRGTFDVVAGFDPWPYAIPVVVLSSSMQNDDVPEALRDKVRVKQGAPREVMDALGREGWTRAYIDGGKVIQSFLREGLIEDMVISRLPVLIGSGLPLFGAVDGDVRLEHEATRTYPGGMVQSRYGVG